MTSKTNAEHTILKLEQSMRHSTSRPIQYNFFTTDLYYISKGVMTKPLEFIKYAWNFKTNISKWDIIYKRVNFNALNKVWNWASEVMWNLKYHVVKSVKNIKDIEELRIYNRIDAIDYQSFEAFNGSVVFLNDSTPPDTSREVIKLFNYISIYHFLDMWDYRKSDFKPMEQNATSTFGFYLMRDLIKWILYRIERWRRSPYISFIFGQYALENEPENCKVGWPLFPDPQFFLVDFYRIMRYPLTHQIYLKA